MRKIYSLAAGSAVAGLLASTPLAAPGVPSGTLVGEEAFGGYEQSRPGVERLIRPGDMPAPFATESAENAPEVVPRPDGAMPEVAADFSVSLVASDFEQPRVIRVAPNGDLFVADSEAGEVRVLRIAAGSDEASEDSVFADGLSRPYGIAFYPPGDNPEWVYVANDDSIVRFPYADGDLEASGEPETIVEGIPSEHHWTRDIVFSEDGETLYLAVGSGSNVAEEVPAEPEGGLAAWKESHARGEIWGAEEGRAMVVAFNPDGSGREVLATGIRNCSGMTIQPATGDLWCAVNERDGLGDNVPPDYVTAIEEDAFYGWPWYYVGSNEDPRHEGARPDLAGDVAVPDVLIQAHSAPLNIAFYDGEAFPAEYRGDAFVTLHGSWNRGQRTGYKVVRLRFDESGEPTGVYEDFMTGMVTPEGEVWGRPVGVAVADDGSLYVTDDGTGSIWRVTHGQGEM